MIKEFDFLINIHLHVLILEDLFIRLVGGDDANSGRMEVMCNLEWGQFVMISSITMSPKLFAECSESPR